MMGIVRLLLVASAVAHLVSGEVTKMNDGVQRNLSFLKIAGYEPATQVTGVCSLDLDQTAIEQQLAIQTPESFQVARRIYQQGGHSGAQAQIVLATPLSSDVSKGTEVVGPTANGGQVYMITAEEYSAGTAGSVNLVYVDPVVPCTTGGLVKPNTEGCLASTGTVTLQGLEHEYSYDPLTDNTNGRTIAGLSLLANEQMWSCSTCPYQDFSYHRDYYGISDYADEWVMAAMTGRSTNFADGNADFSQYSMAGREECAKRGMVLLNVFMYVIRQLEYALDQCTFGAVSPAQQATSSTESSSPSIHAWDAAVCYYTGSLEGKDGLSSGVLLHQLADNRCANFKTCGEASGELVGTASVNYQILQLLTVGQFHLLSGDCEQARDTMKRITQLMHIPLIQGALRYAYRVEILSSGEKAAAEAASFAAALLPRIHAADTNAAQIVFDNLKVGATSTSFAAVKAALESVYPALGITCEDAGGLWNAANGEYFDAAEPCNDAVRDATDAPATPDAPTTNSTGPTSEIDLPDDSASLSSVYLGVVVAVVMAWQL